MAKELHQLQRGTNLRCNAGNVRVIEFIGEGGQGEVYRVELNGRQYALKYYFKHLCDPSLKNNLQYIINEPIESKSFAWPLYLVENGDQFGYVMELLPSGYHDIAEWIGGRFDTTLDILVKACLALCDGFHNLHAKGYSYKDISNSNVSFDPKSGEVLIVDNDNVTPNLRSSGVIGTNGFMAPELISGRTRVPSRLTDLHSLAVLLFQMLVGEHPLNGKKEYHMSLERINEEDILSELYGPDTACFIFSDKYDLNRYIETAEPAHVNARELWAMYPEFIQDMFRRAFMEGIKNPHARPLSNEWTDAFIKLLGLLYKCPHCGKTHLYDRELFYKCGGSPTCDKCGRTIHVPRMKIGDNVVLMTDNAVLYSCYFESNAEDKFAPVLEVEINRGRMRFKNLSNHVVECHSMRARRGEYTDYITSSDSIKVDGKEYRIAL